MIENLAIAGGGVKGLAHIGALQVLEKTNILNIKKIVGTSMGAIIAALYGSGYDAMELKTIMEQLNFEKLLDSNWELIENTLTIFKNYGFYTGNKIKSKIEKLLSQKLGPNITFEEYYKKTNISLIITGTCISKQNIKYFNKDDTPNMIVSDAIRISMSIPFLFTPSIYENDYYTDGGILDNLSDNFFDINNKVNKKTLSLDLVSKYDMIPDRKIETIKDFSCLLIDTMLKFSNKVLDTVDDKKKNIIKIYTGTISSTNFKLTNEDKQYLFNQGVDAAIAYVKKLGYNIDKKDIDTITITKNNKSCNII